MTIVVSYRRYYDWIISYHNQLSKGDVWASGVFQNDGTDEGQKQQSLPNRMRMRPSINDALGNTTWRKSIDSRYTLALAKRFEKYFDNVVVMNLHHDDDNVHAKKDKDYGGVVDIVGNFYCQVMPSTNHTCQAVEQEVQNNLPPKNSFAGAFRSGTHHLPSNSDNSKASRRKKGMEANKSQPLVYEDLTFAAHQSNLISIQTKQQYDKVVEAVKKHHRRQMKLLKSTSSYREGLLLFPRNFPPDDIIEDIWNISLEAETKFNSLDHRSAASMAAFKDDFNKCTKTTFCEVDLDAVLQSPNWKSFFRSLTLTV